MAYSIGCDIVRIDRIRPSLAHTILTPAEQKQYKQLQGKRALEFLAGHFAAKEAIFKTLDLAHSDFKAIEIVYDQKGKPIGRYQAKEIAISISHEQDYAMAVAIRVDE